MKFVLQVTGKTNIIAINQSNVLKKEYKLTVWIGWTACFHFPV